MTDFHAEEDRIAAAAQQMEQASDARRDYEAATAAATAAAEQARSPVSSEAPSPSPEYVPMDALKTWITDELTPKLTAILQRLGALEQQVDLLRQETHGADTDEYVETFNRAQAEHEATHTSISERLASTAEEVTDLGARISALEGVHIAGLEPRPEPKVAAPAVEAPVPGPEQESAG